MNEHNNLRNLVEPEQVADISRYMRRLIIEAPYIMARLHNPGGSILLMPTSNPDQVSYGTEIGNDAHLDLIETGMVLGEDFSKGEREDLYQWALGMTSAQAAEYNLVKRGAIANSAAIRKRRERLMRKLETRMNGRINLGGPSDRVVEDARSPEGEQSSEAGDTGRTETETSSQERDSLVSNSGKAET